MILRFSPQQFSAVYVFCMVPYADKPFCRINRVHGNSIIVSAYQLDSLIIGCGGLEQTENTKVII